MKRCFQQQYASFFLNNSPHRLLVIQVQVVHVSHVHIYNIIYIYMWYETLGLSMEIFKYEYNLSRKN